MYRISTENIDPLIWFDRHVLSEIEGLTMSGVSGNIPVTVKGPLILSWSKDMGGPRVASNTNRNSLARRVI